MGLLDCFDRRQAGPSEEANPARSEEHTSESSHLGISYAVFCLKKKKSMTFARLTKIMKSSTNLLHIKSNHNTYSRIPTTAFTKIVPHHTSTLPPDQDLRHVKTSS